MRRALAILLIGAGSVLGWSATVVGAATVDDAGWWDRNADALLPQIDPPPDGAIRVGNDPAGASAIAAVRFQLDEGEDAPSLVLRVAGDPVPEGAAFTACPATSEWTGASGAPLSEAPESDCDAATALGLVSGTTVSFDLSQLADGPIVDIVISPAPTGESPVTDTFTVDFEAPVATDITTGGPVPDGPATPDGPPSTGGFTPPPAIGGGGGSSGGGGGSSSPSFSPVSPSGGFTAPGSPTVTVPGVDSPPSGAMTGAPPVTTVDAEEAASPPLADASDSSKRWIGLLTAVAIIGLGLYLWRADRARAVLTAGPVIGGLGPFVRERSGPAPEVA